jgi:hypothetical protein
MGVEKICTIFHIPALPFILKDLGILLQNHY